MSHCEISTVLLDITEIRDIDAIVNSTNRHLNLNVWESVLPKGGITKAIHDKAGKELEKECKRILEEKKKLKRGEAVITSSYGLSDCCKYIIHTATPHWDKDKKEIPEEKDRMLRDSYQNVLNVAKEHNVRSIAFPSLGTGGHHFPVEHAAEIAAEAVHDYLNDDPDAFDSIVFSFLPGEENNKQIYDIALSLSGEFEAEVLALTKEKGCDKKAIGADDLKELLKITYKHTGKLWKFVSYNREAFINGIFGIVSLLQLKYPGLKVSKEDLYNYVDKGDEFFGIKEMDKKETLTDCSQ